MVKNKRNTRMFIYFGIILLIILVVLIFYIPQPAYLPYSTSSPEPDGTKALYLLLEQEGFGSSRLTDAVPRGQGLMVMVEPSGNLREQDWQQVLAWVNRGNTLLLASDNPEGLSKRYKYEIINVPGIPGTQQINSVNPLLRDVRELTLSGETRFKKHKAMTFTYGDEQGIFLAETVQGKGRIIFLTMPDLFTNKEINKKDNLILFLNIVRLYGQEGVWFNEFANGFAWREMKEGIFTWPLRLAAMQFVLAVLLLYYYWGKRFGRAIPLPDKIGLVSGDYVSSLANIYRMGRARQLTLDSIYLGFKRDLAQYLGVADSLSNEELVKIFSGRPRIDAEKLKDLLRRSAGLLAKPDFSEKDLFSIARDMEIWRKSNLDSGAKS